jgi:hypothetical protein
MQDVPPPETEHHRCLGDQARPAGGFFMQLPK